MSSIIRVDTLQKPDGSTPTAADLGIDVAGSVVQVVSSSFGYAWTTSTSYTDTGLSATITPKNANNKIIVMATHPGAGIQTPSGVGDRMYLRLVRDGSEVVVFDQLFGYTYTTMRFVANSANTYVDSPATTSPTTYKTQFHAQGGEEVCVGYGSGTCTITLIEIAQ